MSTIVPYGAALAAIRARRYYRKAKPYLPLVRKGAVMAYKLMRKRRGARLRGRARKRVAFKPPNYNAGTAHSKAVSVVADTTASTLNSGTIVNLDLTDIDFSATNSMDNRHGHVINCRGFHMCFEVSNETTDQMYFNWAIVVPKPGAANPTGTTTTEFFRNNDTEPRAMDFNAANMSGLTMHCAPINTDAYYVIRHKRYTLGPLPSGTSTLDNRANSRIKIDQYIKYNRQIRFNDSTDNDARGGKPRLIYWCSPSETASGWTVASFQCVLYRRVKTYFNEPRNS